MSKTVVYIHGHSHKPAAGDLVAIWDEALRAGLERDWPDKVALFDAASRHSVYFADLNAELRAGSKPGFDAQLDVADRRNAIARLRDLSRAKKFNRYQYENVPGKSALAEFLADIGAPVLGKTGLLAPVLTRLMPELAAYWETDSDYHRECSQRTLSLLTSVLTAEAPVMIVAHGFGGVLAYDALWRLSHADGDLAAYRDRKIDCLVTLGTPLADDTVRARLAGADQPPARRYPCNLLKWYNIAAEDDYVCHDKTVADDFAPMLKQHAISVIEDFRIYNLAVRYGKSNPHSVVGYLIHPRIAKLLAAWL